MPSKMGISKSATTLIIIGIILAGLSLLFFLTHSWVYSYPIVFIGVQRECALQSNCRMLLLREAYKDEILDIAIDLKRSDISVVQFLYIANIGSYPFEILWNDVRSIYKGKSYRVSYCDNIKLTAAAEWPLSKIKHREVLKWPRLPAIHIEPSDHILQDFRKMEDERVTEAADFHLIMPLKLHKGSIREYIFTFRIKGQSSGWKPI